MREAEAAQQSDIGFRYNVNNGIISSVEVKNGVITVTAHQKYQLEAPVFAVWEVINKDCFQLGNPRNESWWPNTYSAIQHNMPLHQSLSLHTDSTTNPFHVHFLSRGTVTLEELKCILLAYIQFQDDSAKRSELFDAMFHRNFIHPDLQKQIASVANPAELCAQGVNDSIRALCVYTGNILPDLKTPFLTRGEIKKCVAQYQYFLGHHAETLQTQHELSDKLISEDLCKKTLFCVYEKEIASVLQAIPASAITGFVSEFLKRTLVHFGLSEKNALTTIVGGVLAINLFYAFSCLALAANLALIVVSRKNSDALKILQPILFIYSVTTNPCFYGLLSGLIANGLGQVGASLLCDFFKIGERKTPVAAQQLLMPKKLT